MYVDTRVHILPKGEEGLQLPIEQLYLTKNSNIYILFLGTGNMSIAIAP